MSPEPPASTLAAPIEHSSFDVIRSIEPVVSPPNWTPLQIRKMLDKCDGGTSVWAAAKAANGGKDPVINPGKVASGRVNTVTGEITLSKHHDVCFAAQVQIQELSNLSHKKDFADASTSCLDGKISREGFIRAYELAEYDGVKKVIKAFDSCKDKWGCKTCQKEWARKYTSFDEYYKKGLSNEHKEEYGKWWDDHCKDSYAENHTL